MPPVTIDELTIADEPATWAALGFAVEDAVCQVGSVPLRLAGRDAGPGLIGWTLRGASSEQLDGLPTRSAQGTAREPVVAALTHPNGIRALDHVVAIAPALDRTVAVLQAAGLDLRRVREEPTPAGAPRQAFFRLGDAILEVVQAPEEAIARSGGPDGPAFFWGIAFKVADLDATVAAIGKERCSGPRPAVQPSRRIATLRRTAGLALPVALMTE
jgi:catechol 2,3-dioxygenase-like lactoylglutathione lyase family enzyme